MIDSICRGQKTALEVSSFLLPIGFWGLNSAHWTWWWHAPSPKELSYQPFFFFFLKKRESEREKERKTSLEAGPGDTRL